MLIFGDMPLLKPFLACTVLLLWSCNSEPNNTKLAPEPPQLKVDETAQEEDLSPDQGTDLRMSWQKPFDVIKALGPLEDKVVVDLGAGIGYFSFKLLPKCKKVIAVDIDKEKIEILEGFKSTLSPSIQENLDIRLAKMDDPSLAASEADIIFIVNTITYLSPRVEYLRNLRGHLKNGGKLFIVDYKNKRLPDFVPAPSFSDRLVMYKLEEQLEAAGYKNITTDDTSLDFQYMISAEL